MTRFSRLLSVALLALLSQTAPEARAADSTDQATFDLAIRGIGAGTLAFTGIEKGRGYAVSGKLQTTGLVAMFRKVRYDAKAQGSVAKGRYVPTSYAEKSDTGRRQSESLMAYKKGVPQVKVYNPPRPPRAGDVDPATQGGTVDPLTALYATMRDVEPGQECKVSVTMFDGRHRSQLALATPQAKGDQVVCAGEYRRLQGFSAKDMAERVRFPFTLTYSPTEEGKMRVTDVAMETLYGRATLKRR